jgi:hypothetical protein
MSVVLLVVCLSLCYDRAFQIVLKEKRGSKRPKVAFKASFATQVGKGDHSWIYLKQESKNSGT